MNAIKFLKEFKKKGFKILKLKRNDYFFKYI